MADGYIPSSSDNNRDVVSFTHGDELEFLPHDVSHTTAMIAGACAGVAEHVTMFPVDTIKTRMQSSRLPGQPTYRSITHALLKISRHEGFARLYRGITATVAGAIPSHAVYFATYEYFKEAFGGNKFGYHPLAQGMAGGLATMAHDAVVTPLDVVKQRLQLYESGYIGVTHCIRRIILEDGLRAFYASYPTTVVMNVPFMCVHFATYESLKHMFSDSHGHHGALQHMLAGGSAGALGGLVSNPVDVVKTRIQTQGLNGARRFSGAPEAVRYILKHEGISSFWNGVTPRMVYFAPSAAICWTTYEFLKSVLNLRDDDHDHDHDHHG